MGTAGNQMVAAVCDADLARWDRVACMRACPIAREKLRPAVGKMVRVTSFLREPLSPVLPGSGRSLAAAWPWLFVSHGTAEWNLLWPFLFQSTFSRVHLMLSRARPARLSVEQAAVVQRSTFRWLLRVRHCSNKYRRHDRDRTFLNIHFSPCF